MLVINRVGLSEFIPVAVIVAIQQLPKEDREHILYTIDGLIQHTKTRQAYKK